MFPGPVGALLVQEAILEDLHDGLDSLKNMEEIKEKPVRKHVAWESR